MKACACPVRGGSRDRKSTRRSSDLHAILAIDPGALAGSDLYFSRLETMIAGIVRDEGVRLPGARRQQMAAAARSQGLTIADQQLSELLWLAGVKII